MAMSTNQPVNLHLLPSFISQDLQPDGCHLTPVSGLHYIIHLFDHSEAALALHHCNPEIKMAAVQESVRQHDDRLSYLESRHLGLHDRVNLKMASDAEFKDWTINRNEEDSFTVMGLPRLGKMTSGDWQKAARKQVSDLIKTTLSCHRVKLDCTVLYVSNPVRRRTTGMTVYNVRVSSVFASQRIRELYSGFFRKEDPAKLPSHLRGVSVRNKVTLATRIRLRIMRELGNLYVASNSGASFKVKGFDPRPLLTTTPAPGSSDRPQAYNFVEAATSLPASFSDDALASIFQVVGTHHEGELRSLFIVINDDERERCLELVQNARKTSTKSRATAGVTAPLTSSGRVFGYGTGMDLEAQFLASLRAAPPPPPPPLLPPVPELTKRRVADVPDHSPHGGLKRRQQSPSTSEDRGPKKSKRSRRSSSESSSSSGHRRHRKRPRRSRGSRRSRRSSTSSSSSGSRSTPQPTKSKTLH